MDVDQLDAFLLIGGVVLLAGILAVRLSVRIGLPSLLIYLGMGLVLGEGGLGIRFDDAQLAHALGFGALVLILAEGGLTTRWSEARPSMPSGLLLATVGVGVSVVVVGVIAHLVLGFEWKLAFMLGAVTSPTDAAAVFSMLRRVPLRRRLSGALESESGLNDAPTVVLVTLLSTGELERDGPIIFGLTVGYELLAGAALGIVLGVLGIQVLRRAAFPTSGLYPLAIMTFCVVAYAVAGAVHASGFAAVYVAALVLGNAELPHRTATHSFAEGMASIAQIGLFVMLGLLAWPSPLDTGDVVAAVVAGVLLTFIARPVSVFLAMLPFHLPLREQAFLSWAGLRGAVPIVLATIPLAENFEHAGALFDAVFVLVIIFTLVQGPTLPWAARQLRVLVSDEYQDLELESAPLERIDADLLQLRILAASKLHGVEVGELRLPTGASVSLVVRGGESFTATSGTVLRHGDDLLIVAPRAVRMATERRLRAVSRSGRLAGWFGERGTPA